MQQYNVLFTAILPVIGYVVSYLIQQDGYSDNNNAIIATCTILACAIIRIALQGLLDGDLPTALTAIAVESIALQNESLAPLSAILRSKTSITIPPTQQTPPVILVPPGTLPPVTYSPLFADKKPITPLPQSDPPVVPAPLETQ